MPCNDACGELELIDNPLICNFNPRRKTLSQFGFYACSTSFPSPLTPEGIEALITGGEVVWSNPLSNVTVNDPATEDVNIADCQPASRVLISREITAQDRIAVDVEQGSPLVPAPYWDYDFWKNKSDLKLSLYYLIRYCDGDVVFANGANGLPLTADLLVYLNWDAVNNGAPRVEFKQVSLIFNGDPLALSNKPLFNIAADGTVTVY